MLRARTRAWQDRGRPFVCTLCRQRLSSSTGHHATSDRALSATAAALTPSSTPLSPRWAARSLSTTAFRRNDADGQNHTPGSGPPRLSSFPGAFGRSGGSWGSLATSVNRPQRGGTLGDGLLPHEREARMRSAAAAPPPPKPPARPAPSRSNGNPRKDFAPRGHHGHYGHGQGKGKGSWPNRDQAQATLSRSVLTNIFQNNREPKVPPTPKSWLTGGEDSKSKTAAPAPAPPTTAKLGGSSAYSPSPFSAMKLSGQDKPSSSNFAGGINLGSKSWGSFADRKAEISHRSPEQNRPGNKSTAPGGTTQSGQTTKDRAPNQARIRRFDREGPAQEAPAAPDAPRQDFWGELEARTSTDFKDRGKDRRDVSQRGEDVQQKGGFAGARRAASDDRKLAADTQPQTRRNSRFDIEESEGLEGRRTKNVKSSKNAQKSRHRTEDQDWDDEAVERWEQKQRRKAEKEAARQQALQEPQVVPIFLPEYISASNLSKALKQKVDQFLRDMEEMGFENVTGDTIFTGETAALVAMEYGFEPTVDSGTERDLRPRPAPEDATVLPSRPPVVTIMGHVDHGKTTLLDWLRKSSIAAQEHGGITQHIGAFVVKMSSGKAITFLDTPGHAAFLSMRQRGANVTDIVVLVVAADDSVKPQTLEALKHATTAKVPIIVAINKIDKEDAKIDQVKADLGRHGVEIEDFGGDVQVVCVSGKTGQGMEDLEENIVTLSEVLDVRAEDDGMAEGWILESSIKAQGRTATVLVKRGTLRPGDLIVAGQTWARIRTLRNEAGQELASAPPGTPVEILGWRELPVAGEQVLQSPDEKKAKSAVEYRLEMSEREQSSVQLAEHEQRLREKAAAALSAAEEGTESKSSTQTSPAATPEPGVIYQNITVKADVVGSVEAVCATVLELGNHEVRPKILRSSAGPISEYDVDHAAASGSVIVNFNVPIQPHIKQRAEEAKVPILDHKVIYHVVDDVKAALSKLLPPAVSYRVTGEADVVQVFAINVKGRTYRNIAGCRVRNGSMKRASRVKILRRGKVVFEGKLDTLKHVKKDVQEMAKNTECGIGLDGFEDFQADDQIQTFEEIREKRYL